MRAFDMDVFPRNGSWLIRVGDQVMSGAPARARAERIARIAADSLRAAGSEVRLSIAAGDGAPAVDEVLPARLRTAA